MHLLPKKKKKKKKMGNNWTPFEFNLLNGTSRIKEEQ